MALLPGQIYFAEANGGRRPVIVVSREELNRGHYIIAVPLTSAAFETRSKQRHCLPIQAGEFGLPKNCVAQAEAITFIEVAALDLRHGVVGKLDDSRMRGLVKAIGYVISSDCEPS